jgi:hypothetical protein
VKNEAEKTARIGHWTGSFLLGSAYLIHVLRSVRAKIACSFPTGLSTPDQVGCITLGLWSLILELHQACIVETGSGGIVYLWNSLDGSLEWVGWGGNLCWFI